MVAIKSPDLAGGRAGAYGLYENHNDYTFIILMVLPFVYYFIKLSSSRTAKLVLLTLLCACVAGVMLSLSRGGILALVLEFILIFAALNPRLAPPVRFERGVSRRRRSRHTLI